MIENMWKAKNKILVIIGIMILSIITILLYIDMIKSKENETVSPEIAKSLNIIQKKKETKAHKVNI